ncbi:hypothetical protein [Desulfobotulus mexicanus]|uniref:Uncharacterized protein n=1 Tax=Desulfobotulus mexicanus TaxID=2586642 RepID=A0A5S5MF60_9BACT|nr:hypothetical protein [Desulfobotulus mexicanus]TYT74317.1 hypothetical protein FIM25_10165 [Desulfobotulus mexicanus]
MLQNKKIDAQTEKLMKILDLKIESLQRSKITLWDLSKTACAIAGPESEDLKPLYINFRRKENAFGNFSTRIMKSLLKDAAELRGGSLKEANEKGPCLLRGDLALLLNVAELTQAEKDLFSGYMKEGPYNGSGCLDNYMGQGLEDGAHEMRKAAALKRKPFLDELVRAGVGMVRAAQFVALFDAEKDNEEAWIKAGFPLVWLGGEGLDLVEGLNFCSREEKLYNETLVWEDKPNKRKRHDPAR